IADMIVDVARITPGDVRTDSASAGGRVCDASRPGTEDAARDARRSRACGDAVTKHIAADRPQHASVGAGERSCRGGSINGWTLTRSGRERERWRTGLRREPSWNRGHDPR